MHSPKGQHHQSTVGSKRHYIYSNPTLTSGLGTQVLGITGSRETEEKSRQKTMQGQRRGMGHGDEGLMAHASSNSLLKQLVLFFPLPPHNSRNFSLISVTEERFWYWKDFYSRLGANIYSTMKWNRRKTGMSNSIAKAQCHSAFSKEMDFQE